MMVEEDKQIKAELLANLQERRERVKQMGRRENVERQKKRGKLTARERIDKLLDEGTFCEIAIFGINRGTAFGMDKIEVPADAVVTGYGKIDGRKVYIFSQDFTSIGGT